MRQGKLFRSWALGVCLYSRTSVALHETHETDETAQIGALGLSILLVTCRNAGPKMKLWQRLGTWIDAVFCVPDIDIAVSVPECTRQRKSWGLPSSLETGSLAPEDSFLFGWN